MKKFVALLMVVSLFVSVLNVASSDSNFLILNSVLSDFTTDPIFEKGLDNKEAQAALVVLVCDWLEEKGVDLARKSSSTAYVSVSQGENAAGKQVTDVSIYYDCSAGCYLYVVVTEGVTFLMENALAEDKYSMIDFLDNQGFAYCAIPAEALDKAVAYLEAK